MPRAWITFTFCILLAACQSSAPAQTTPEAASSDALVQWDRSPETILFRADITGGDLGDDVTRLSEVPRCTVYGDNRVVWINEIAPPQTEVLYDRVTDEAISGFVSYLTVDERIYTYEPAADLRPPSSATPMVETIQLFVNAREHRADAFSGWDSEWFSRVVKACQAISGAPVLFEPQGVWLSAAEIPYDINAAIIAWDAAAASLSLADIAGAGTPRWITDNNARVLWNMVRTQPANVQFLEGERYFRIGLQVPGVTRTAPPAPAG